jgi:enamine deaminase RidA (YjgF/YER057c/UK114 family)
MSKAEYLKPKGLAINPAYSHVAIASGARTIYIAGQVSIDEKGAVVGAGDLAAQTQQVMRNLERCLAAAGATFQHVVKITTYVVDYTPDKRAVIAKERTPFFADRPPPASTLVGVSALAAPEWMIEIEAIAVID